MKLGTAANYFADTPVAGWNGTAWVEGVTTVTLLPYDRFVSNHEFGYKRRMILVRVDDTSLATYPVIKFPSGEAYIVGSENPDIQGEEYSVVVLLHRAPALADILGFTKVVKASGMAGSATRTVLGTAWCDAERVTFSNSKEFAHIAFTQSMLTLPRDAVVDTENEVHIGGEYYTISESFMSSGFRTCRAMAKRSS